MVALPLQLPEPLHVVYAVCIPLEHAVGIELQAPLSLPQPAAPFDSLATHALPLHQSLAAQSVSCVQLVRHVAPLHA
jgi:hypothetical protein